MYAAAMTEMWILAGLVAMASMLLVSLGSFFRRAEHGLSVGERQILAAFSEAALASVPWGADIDRVGVMRAIAEQLAPMPNSARVPFQLGLFLYRRAPLFLLGDPRRFDRLSVQRRNAVVAAIEHRPGRLFGPLQEGMTALCMLVLAAQPAALAAAKIDRARWVAERRAARGEGSA